MEIRGQARGPGMPNSMGYDLPQLNQESAIKLPSASIASTVPERNDPGNSTIISPNQTLDRHNLTQHQHHQHHDHHHQQQVGHRDGSPDADPAPAPVTSPSSSKTVPSPSSQPTPQPTASVSTNSTSIRYRECLKNHAANMGAHVLDGCGEFMPSGEEGTLEALKCAACDCHRNFHWKEIEGEREKGTSYHSTYHLTRADNIPHRTTRHHTHPPISTMPPQHQHQHQQQQQQHKYPPMAPMMMAFGGNSGSPAEYSSSEDLNMYRSNTGPYAVLQPSYSMSKKRIRTKFTQQQKDKMHEFAEKLGWRIQKQDEQEVQQFCDEVGVKRQVFKVWMHNNKQAMKKKHM